MALTQGARNKIKSFVQEIKRKLIVEFEAQLQSLYGIRPDGTCLMVEELTAKEAAVIQTAALLRGRLEYIKTTIAGKNKDAEAVAQLVREQAFTVLNRLAALRMAEERNIIRESIRKGYNSEGFKVYDQLTGGATSADQFSRYSWYLNAVFDELAVDLPAIFDRYSPYALLFPAEKVVLELLDIINDHTLVNYREEGYQLMNLWKEDETIGWVYQYYNSREEISAMREASGAPRNSRELAVRNQFFTPRYVVQFLVDNSLGQQWYEMTQGNTQLPEHCEYMVKRPKVIFLDKGVQVPEEKAEDTHYIDYRALKDPREILMLDPACGSMHFGLYCFDLYEIIYQEAWDNFPNLMQDLRDKWTRTEFVKQIPAMILRHNIHGVDIDPRAIQMAGLSLWLRAQRYYDGLKLEPKDRPSIYKSNLVVAEPLPGDEKLLNDFAQSLPGPIAKLLRVIWDKMKLAGETGLLLKIEEELKKEIAIAKEEWKQYKDTTAQGTLFDSPQASKVAEMAAIYGKGQKITKDFFDTAEEEVLKALETFAENAQGANAFQKLLFAEDTARGFAFIELCRKRYDVIFQNPPFGAASRNSELYIDSNYSLSKNDLASVFIDRTLGLLVRKGNLGSITTRTIFFLGSYTKWRSKELLDNNHIKYFADLGEGVLDAMVETSAYVIENNKSNRASMFFKVTDVERKDIEIFNLISNLKENNVFHINPKIFKLISNEPFCYWIDGMSAKLFREKRLISSNQSAIVGLQTSDNLRFARNRWENDNSSIIFGYLIGDSSSRYYLDSYACVNYEEDGRQLKHSKAVLRNTDYYLSYGISWSTRTSKFQPYIVNSGHIPSVSRYLINGANYSDCQFLLSYLNSEYVDYLLKLSMDWVTRPKFIVGVVNQLPIPDFSFEMKDRLSKISQEQIQRVQVVYMTDDKSVIFSSNQFLNYESINHFASNHMALLKSLKNDFISSLDGLNTLVYDFFKMGKNEQEGVKKIVSKSEDDEGHIFDLSLEDMSFRVYSILLGCVFCKWDMRILKNWKPRWSDDDIFKARKHSPFLFGTRESTLDLVLPEFHDKIKAIWEMPYPIEVLEECATVSDLNPVVDKLKEVIRYFWPETYDTIIEELLEHFKVNELEEIFDKHSKFFDVHLKDYSRNKRVSPIYWHLGVPSGKFNVWIYFPKLNNDSLYKIVNDLVEPKIKDIAQEVAVLEMSNDSKELNDQKEFLAELQDFKEELLRVAQLPYRLNQDDGVLITAAPLHNLFRHTKWRKSTEDCWKQLKKGEYDWAHLAYSIWPDRVKEKCKKDLSMAIAHGLEDICEVKTKETKPQVKKGVKEDKQQKLL